MIKSPAQYSAGNRLRVIAHSGWRPVPWGRSTSWLGRGLAAWSSHVCGLYARAHGAVAGLPTVASWWRGSPREHQRGSGVTPGKSGGGGTYPSGGAAVRREESSGTMAFTGGEGALVVMVECDEVLQLGRGKGVRILQEIVRIGGSGRSSPGNGGRRRRSAEIQAREGLPAAGGGGPGAGSGERWERCGAREGGRRVVGDRGVDGISGTF
jgi:hypothetical protein